MVLKFNSQQCIQKVFCSCTEHVLLICGEDTVVKYTVYGHAEYTVHVKHTAHIEHTVHVNMALAV